MRCVMCEEVSGEMSEEVSGEISEKVSGEISDMCEEVRCVRK